MRGLLLAVFVAACAGVHEPERATLEIAPLEGGCAAIERTPGAEGGLAIPRQAVCPIVGDVSPTP